MGSRHEILSAFPETVKQKAFILPYVIVRAKWRTTNQSKP